MPRRKRWSTRSQAGITLEAALHQMRGRRRTRDGRWEGRKMRIAASHYLALLGLAATFALGAPAFAQAPRATPTVTQQQEIESEPPPGQGSLPLEDADQTTGRADRSQF